MRLPLTGVRREEATAAPFAVVAVVLMLGAGVSYAYMAHLRTTRMDLEGLEPWTSGAVVSLEREVRRLRTATSIVLEGVLGRSGSFDSRTLVASMADACEVELTGWACQTYPYRQRDLRVRAGTPSMSLSPVFGMVTTGNPLGCQVPQLVPVEVEAVATMAIEVAVDGGPALWKEAVVREHLMAPQLTAAYLQDRLELSLSHEGLVPSLLVDGLEARVTADPDLEPDLGQLRLAVRMAVGAAQVSLFRSDTTAAVNWRGYGANVDGHEVWQVSGPGEVSVEVPAGDTLLAETPLAGGLARFRLVPWVDWRGGPMAEVRLDRMHPAEAGGTEGACLARLNYSGQLTHRVDAWVGGEMVGSVVRDMTFREHLTAVAESEDLLPGDDDGHVLPQVEDWDLLHRMVDQVSPPPRELVLQIDPAFGEEVEVCIDGVPMGSYRGDEAHLPNVPSGPHQVLVRSRDAAVGTVTFDGRVVVDTGKAPTILGITPHDGPAPQAAYAFWYSIMSALHASDAGALSHLELITSAVGYPPAPWAVQGDPSGHLGELAYWLEGLRRHVDLGAGDLAMRGGVGPLASLELVEDVISISGLTLDLLLDLPERVDKTRCVITLMGDGGASPGFSVRCTTTDGVLDLIEGYEECDLYHLRFTTRTGEVVRQVGDVMSALAIIGESLSLAFDIVELADSLEEGEGARIMWASLELGFDMAQMVLSALKLAADAGLLAIGKVGQATIAVVGAAISVVATFLDAYREAGGDVGDAFGVLLDPASFSDGLRTAGFMSGLASLVTTVVVTSTLVAGGATVAGAFTVAVMAASGVGLVVLAVALAVWAAFHWEQVSGWYHGTAPEGVMDQVAEGVDGVLGTTMWTMARLSHLDLEEEMLQARAERGVGLALSHVRSTSGVVGLVRALGGAPRYHLDTGAAMARTAKAAEELRYSIITLWRQVDDLVDDDHARDGDERSEGYADDRGLVGKDHDFDADIQVRRDGGAWEDLSQADGTLDAFVRDLTYQDLAVAEVRFHVDGEVFGGALDAWLPTLDAALGRLSLASIALSHATWELTYVGSVGPEAAYTREMGMLRFELPEGADGAHVVVDCLDGSLVVDGEVRRGPVHLNVTDGALLTVTGRGVVCSMLNYEEDGQTVWVYGEDACSTTKWYELEFGRSVLSMR